MIFNSHFFIFVDCKYLVDICVTGIENQVHFRIIDYETRSVNIWEAIIESFANSYSDNFLYNVHLSQNLITVIFMIFMEYTEHSHWLYDK